MYIPRKAWQKYEKLIQNNLILDSENEIVYKLGDEKWMMDVYRLANLIKKDCFEVAIKYQTINFLYTYIYGEVSHENDYFNDVYWLFDGHQGYVSYIQKSNYIKEFNEKMENSDMYLRVEKNYCESMLQLGFSNTYLKNNDTETDIKGDDEAW